MIDLNEVDESYFDSLFAESESLVSEGLGYYRIEVEAGDIVNLITRLREAERDAARYRWFVDNSVFGMKQNGASWSLSFYGPAPEHSGKIGEYIDQAMKEKGDE